MIERPPSAGPERRRLHDDDATDWDPHPAFNEQFDEEGQMSALARITRGLSAQFWALPLALLVVAMTGVRTIWGEPTPLNSFLRSLGVLPGVAVYALLLYGGWQMRPFQPQERIWQRALNSALVVALINFGLSPFLFWWSRAPEVVYFQATTVVLLVGSLIYLALLNRVLRRLTAMLPDQTLREETALLSRLNLVVLSMLAMGVAGYQFAENVVFADSAHTLSARYVMFVRIGEIALVLSMVIPIATTMALLWKIKDTIFHGLFAPRH